MDERQARRLDYRLARGAANVCQLAQFSFGGMVEADQGCPCKVVVLLSDDFSA